MTKEMRNASVPQAAATAALSVGIPRMPGGYPFFGHAFQLRFHPLEFVQSLRAEGDVVAFRLGPRMAYAVNHPELINQMLVADAKKFEKGKMFEKGRLVARNGLFTSEGDFHLRQRRIIQPLFHQSYIARYTATIAVILSVILREYSLYPALARPAEPIVRLLTTPSAIPLIVERRTAGREHQEV